MWIGTVCRVWLDSGRKAQKPSNDVLLDSGGAAVDDAPTEIPQVAFDAEFGDVAASAVDFYCCERPSERSQQ